MQHLVTAGYLARFADRMGRVTVVSRASPSQRRTVRVSEAATFRDFYTLQNREGDDRYALERALADVEGDGLEAVRQLCERDEPLSTAQRASICRLVAFQRVRGQRVRRAGEAFSNVIEKLMPGAWLDHDGQLVEGLRRNDAGEVEPDPEEHLGVMVRSARDIERVLIRYHLRLLRFDTPELLTSDEPVQCTRYPGWSTLEGVGPANADEVWFPLDPRSMLVLSPHATCGNWLTKANQRQATVNINQVVATAAYAEIYFTPGRNPLQTFDLSPPGPLVQVGAPHAFDVDGINSPPTRRRPRRR